MPHMWTVRAVTRDAAINGATPAQGWPSRSDAGTFMTFVACSTQTMCGVEAIGPAALEARWIFATPCRDRLWAWIGIRQQTADVRSPFSIAVEHVVQMRADKQMLRSDAERRVAMVKDVQPVRRIVAMCEFPDEAMGVLVALQVAVPEIPIAMVGCSLPEPALPCGIHFRPEPLGQRHPDIIGIVGEIV